MTATTTAPTPEELAARVVSDLNAAFDFKDSHVEEPSTRWVANPPVVDVIAAAIRQHSEALEAENERLRIMADEPTTKRVWDGIQAMAALFSDPGHMPTVLEFKAAFDAAFVVDGKPYDVERIKAEWQADYATLTAERDALAAEADSLRYDAGMTRTLRDRAGKVCGAAQRLVYEMRNHVPSEAALPHASLELQAIRRAYDALSAALTPQEATDER